MKIEGVVTAMISEYPLKKRSKQKKDKQNDTLKRIHVSECRLQFEICVPIEMESTRSST